MRNLFLLLRTYIQTYLGNFASKRGNKGSYLSGGIMVALFGGLFIILFSTTAYGTIVEFKNQGVDPTFALYPLTSIGIVFMLLITILKGTSIKKHSDSLLLISLPIPRHTIVISKILKDFIFDFLALFGVMMPGYVVYAVVSGADKSYLAVIFGLVLLILLALLSNALSIFVNAILGLFTRRLKHASIIQTVISVFITIIFLIFYYWFMNEIQTADADSVNLLKSIYPLKIMVPILINGNVINLLIITGICLIPFILSVIYSSLVFNKSYKGYVNTNKELVFKKSTITKHLFKREVSKYFSSTLYVLNTIIGALFIVLFAFLILIFGLDRIVAMLELYTGDAFKFIMNRLDVILILLMGLITCTAVTTSSSISLEGKEFWILKSSPIKEKDVFHAKLLLNIVIGIIPVIIGSIVLCIRIGFIYLPFLLVILSLYLSWASINGLGINLKYPKMNWRDEQEVIKQSMAVFVTLATTLIPGVVIIGFYSALLIGLNPYLSLTIIILILFILNVISYKILMSKGIKRFKEIYN